jgi:adenosylcobinamide-phosphate synthase
MNSLALAALVLLVEGFVGYPPALYKLIGHPVEWIGKLITYLDDSLNDSKAPGDSQRQQGILALALLCIAVGLPAWIIAKLLAQFSYGWIVNVALATAFVAQKSLRDHVSAVSRALGQSLDAAQKEVGKIVGRDPEALDESGISKAALESLAENTADGITAPIFWYALAGLPGLVIYKAINTADSMIGHKSKKHLHFGWAAAKFDDLINLPASRITGLLFAAAAWITSKENAKSALRSMWRDAGKHQSPNAGWPEAAMAGALNLRFGGPRKYNEELVDLPFMGDGREVVTPADIGRGIEIYDRAMVILLVSFVLLAMVL